MIVKIMLVSNIDVKGIKILLPSLSIRMSPGSFPNQLRIPGAKCRITPVANKIIPAIINQRLIIL